MTQQTEKLDNILLRELLHDGRKSFAQIAKENNTTKEVIAYHFKQLEKKKIIVGSTIKTSCSLNGSSFTVNLLIRVQPPISEEVLSLVAKIPAISVVTPLGLTSTIFSVAQIKNTPDLEQVKSAIRNLPSVLEVDPIIVTQSRSTPENLSVLAHENWSFNLKRPIQNPADATSEIDEIDRAIANKLLICGRAPFSKIAKELKVSTDTVARHYKKLKKNGHISAVIQIDATKIGYRAFALFHIGFFQRNVEENLEYLKSLQDINYLQRTIGKFDVFAILMIKDIDHLTSVQEKISKLPGFTYMEVEVMKMFTVWPPPRELVSTF